MEEQVLKAAKPNKIAEHNESEISPPLLPEILEPFPEQPQRAQIAYYRSQTDRIASYNIVD